MKHLFLILTLFLILPVCKEINKERITRLMEEWEGKEIKYPYRMVFTRFVTDMVDYRMPQSYYKVLSM